ncbi:Ef-Hand Domain-Containing Family Member C2 [Manis pentadactyla]|nr:Ef-Hand Domain-Containing Family Member C2 [Manis pentadactyla]
MKLKILLKIIKPLLQIYLMGEENKLSSAKNYGSSSISLYWCYCATTSGLLDQKYPGIRGKPELLGQLLTWSHHASTQQVSKDGPPPWALTGARSGGQQDGVEAALAPQAVGKGFVLPHSRSLTPALNKRFQSECCVHLLPADPLK